MEKTFFVYILSNWSRKVLYVGVTNDLSRRLLEHVNGTIPGFTQKYNCKDLVYYEQHEYINNAISREKEIKKWRREKKDDLINTFNPEWKSLNDRFIRIKTPIDSSLHSEGQGFQICRQEVWGRARLRRALPFLPVY